MDKKILHESARDLIALGGPIFFIVVLARIALLSNFEYLSQFIVGGILFLTSAFFFKTDLRAGFGLIIVVFTGIYYGNLKFAIFAFVIYGAFLYSLYYLGKSKTEILKSFLGGLAATGISYYVVKLVF